MNQISSKKLLHTKWTATKPIKKDKHFIVTQVQYDEDSVVIKCIIEALMSKRSTAIDWRELKDPQLWQQGWK
jgi:tryptophan-rich hypothetical protein